MKFTNKWLLLGALSAVAFNAIQADCCDCDCDEDYYSAPMQQEIDPRTLQMTAFLQTMTMQDPVLNGQFSAIANSGKIVSYQETDTTLDATFECAQEIPNVLVLLATDKSVLEISAKGNQAHFHAAMQ